jgi:hypothetical protein
MDNEIWWNVFGYLSPVHKDATKRTCKRFSSYSEHIPAPKKNKEKPRYLMYEEQPRLEYVRWAYGNGAKADVKTTNGIIYRERLDIFNWLADNRFCVLRDGLCTVAAKLGDLGFIKRWHIFPNPFCLRDVLENALRYKQLNIVKWCHRNYKKRSKNDSGFISDPNIIALAAFYNNKEAIDWLTDRGAKWDERACSHAAAAGNFELLQWLRQNYAPWNHNVIWEAVRNKHAEIVEWAARMGCPVQRKHIYWAKKTCQQEVAKILEFHFGAQLLKQLRKKKRT